MARITLINPPTVLSMGSLSYQNSIPPLGLAYLTAAARDAGHGVQVIDAPGDAIDAFHPIEGAGIPDLYIHGLTPDEIVARIDSASQLIGITHMFLHAWPLLRSLVRKIKQAHPDKPIVMGGETPTSFWRDLMEQSADIDLCVLGEGERILVELLDAFDERRSWRELEAVVHRDGDGRPVRSAGKRRRETDLESLARPDWESFNVEGYLSGAYSSGVNRGRSIPMQATRGCPYRCTFCSSPNMWTTRYVMREVASVVDEIEDYVRRYRVDNVDFLDLTAIINRRWILAFCEELFRRSIRITWQLPSGTRSEAIDAEVARALYRSGCRNLAYAPESGSPRMLKKIKKQVNLENLVQSLSGSVDAGMVTLCAIILGLPGDGWRDMWLSYKLMLRLCWNGLHSVAVMMFAPYPGSELFEQLRAEGKLELTEGYYYSALLRSGRSSVSYNRFDLRVLLVVQFLFLISFWSLTYLLRPKRLLRTLSRMFRSGQEESIMDKLLHAKLAFRRRRRRAGAPVSLVVDSG
jgi:radical SAM superfamily enzyme YgiQ (UPF0313 family)